MKLICTLLLVAVSLASQCQDAKKESIKERFQNMSYSEVISQCEESLETEDDMSFYARYLADSYRLINNSEKSAYWLNLLVEAEVALDEDYLYLALAEKSLGNYDQATKWFKHYSKIDPKNQLVRRHLNDESYHKSLGQIDKSIEVNNMAAVNSSQNDFSPISQGESMIFSSSRTEGAARKKTYKWDGQNYLDLYKFNLKTGEISPFSSVINTGFHEGPVCFSADGKTAFFTRNNYLKGKKGKDPEGTINLKIYTSHFREGSWVDVSEFKFNSNEFSNGHPTLSADGKVLVYISNSADGSGGTDLYMCKKGLYGWGLPENLGHLLNTEMNEMFPFLHPDGTLYFSSDGHLGLGGLDIFKCEGFMDGKRVIEHLPNPINSPKDDFSYFLSEDKTEGYLASNRPGGMGGDDIYTFSAVPEDTRLALNGTVLNTSNEKPIYNANVELWSGSSFIDSQKTGPRGKFELKVEPEYCPVQIEISYREEWSKYEAEIDHCYAEEKLLELGNVFLEDYGEEAEVYTTTGSTKPKVSKKSSSTQQTYRSQTSASASAISKPKTAGFLITVTDQSTGESWQTESPYAGNVDVQLDRPRQNSYTSNLNGSYSGRNPAGNQQPEIFSGSSFNEDGNRTIVLENIFYDLGRWTLRSDALVELDKVVNTLRSNPSMVIELSSHTDARGTAADNQSLSEKRAMAAVRYIIDQGISAARISGKGYGEYRLRNNCKDGVNCSERQHQENRRTEITILQY